MNINSLMLRLTEITKEAGARLLSQTVTVNSHKTKNDLLTENDLATENYIISELKKYYPDVNIISEEYNPDNELEGITVIIDPIDGTCNYAVGMDLFGIQLAVFDDGVCRASLLYFPVSGDIFTAEKGKGAYLNGKPLRIDTDASPKDGMLFISDYYDSIGIPMDKQFGLVKSLQKHFLKTRHFGAACVDFSMIAKGHGVAYITYYHKIWDIAPGLLIATEAGCVSGGLDGEYRYGEPGLVVATNSETLELIRRLYREV